MARLSLATRNMIKKRKLASVLMLWLDMLSVISMFFQLLCIMVEYRIRKKSLRSRYFNDFYLRRGELHRLIYESDESCTSHFRMDRYAFNNLCNMLVARGGLKDTKHMLVDEQVAMFLHIIAHHIKNRIVKHKFRRSGETVSRHFKDVLQAVIQLHTEFLKKPEPVPENSTDDRWKWFKNCLGALDGTHIKMRVPVVDKPRYRNRKGEITTNVLGEKGLIVPHGYYYLVDAGYTNCKGFLAPYRGQRYHLNDWREGHQPTTSEEFFNMKHSSWRRNRRDN
ncbi:hypothetical protein SLA2020_484460 [Shorea laevis]